MGCKYANKLLLQASIGRVALCCSFLCLVGWTGAFAQPGEEIQASSIEHPVFAEAEAVGLFPYRQYGLQLGVGEWSGRKVSLFVSGSSGAANRVSFFAGIEWANPILAGVELAIGLGYFSDEYSRNIELSGEEARVIKVRIEDRSLGGRIGLQQKIALGKNTYIGIRWMSYLFSAGRLEDPKVSLEGASVSETQEAFAKIEKTNPPGSLNLLSLSLGYLF